MKNLLANITLVTSLSVLALVGCSTNTQKENTTVGAVSGAVVGGLAGSLVGGGAGQVVAIGVGAIAGALIGGEIGHSMDSSDNAHMGHAMNSNTTNHASRWHNRKNHTRYTVKPTSNVMSYQGHKYCRHFESTAVINGQQKTMDGVACREANGVWKSVS